MLCYKANKAMAASLPNSDQKGKCVYEKLYPGNAYF